MWQPKERFFSAGIVVILYDYYRHLEESDQNKLTEDMQKQRAEKEGITLFPSPKSFASPALPNTPAPYTNS